jgi:hypothetical protein
VHGKSFILWLNILTKHSATVQFAVFEMKNDVIIGLPAIMEHYFELFPDMLDVALQTFNSNQSLGTIKHSDGELIMNPWSVPRDDAPEDIENPLPSSFSYFIHYIEQSVEELETVIYM